MSVTALVGGQYGSEGKGLVVGHIANGYQIHVRVGAANAGHTLYTNGDKHVVQQLPCAAYAAPWATCVLGAGALISPEILTREFHYNADWRVLHKLPPLRLYIDERAHVITDQHIVTEQGFDLQERIGSTSATAHEGIGAAQACRVMRSGFVEARALPELRQMATVCDTIELLHQAHIFASDILLEGTQGTGLSLIAGGTYPYVTSRNTTASGLAADCGFGPRDIDSVIMVCRTFPIRVAGNSGPFWPDSREIKWQELGVDEMQERTTVTKKVRRVATLSMEQLKYAARLNSASEIALTFADYLDSSIYEEYGAKAAHEIDAYDRVGSLVRQIEDQTSTPVTYIGTGPATVIDREPDIDWARGLTRLGAD